MTDGQNLLLNPARAYAARGNKTIIPNLIFSMKYFPVEGQNI